MGQNLSRIVRKRDFAYAKTKAQISFAVTAKLISAFVFAISLLLKSEISSFRLSCFCDFTGRFVSDLVRRPVFLRRGSFHMSSVFFPLLHCKSDMIIFVDRLTPNFRNILASNPHLMICGRKAWFVSDLVEKPGVKYDNMHNVI